MTTPTFETFIPEDLCEGFTAKDVEGNYWVFEDDEWRPATDEDEKVEWKRNPEMSRLIDEFFDRMEELGVHCERNWTCCNTCGHAEMVQAWKDGEYPFDGDTAEKKETLQYIFYHQQEDADLMKGATECYLNWELTPEVETEVRKWISHFGEWNAPRPSPLDPSKTLTSKIVLRLSSDASSHT